MSTGAVGNYGTLHFVKKNGSVIASYPIDDDELAIGRGSSCHVRLYYTSVDRLHCKLVFEDRKAMLLVYGAEGVVVDDCHVLPAESGAPATVPLSNGSRVVISSRCFVFDYPPKEMRAALISTPRPSPKKTRRSLRMSMIQTSHVFSPLRAAHTATPQTHAAALTSPVKPFARDLRDEEEVVLVDGDVADAVILEEGRDLIVMEEVDVPPEPIQEMPQSPTPAGRRGVVTLDSLRTPQPNARRRSNFNLHKAVLLRSAQRTLEHSDQHEEAEVELAVSPERELGPPSDGLDEGQTSTSASRSPFKAGLDVLKSVFGRKSTEDIPSTVQDDANQNGHHEDAMQRSDSDEDEDMEDDEDRTPEDDIVLDYGSADGAAQEEPVDGTPRFPPILSGQRNPFLTPQPLSRRSEFGVGMLTGPRRVPVDAVPGDSSTQRQRGLSLGGPQRVRVVEPWKINQIEGASSQTAPKGTTQTATDDKEEDAQVIVDRLKGEVAKMRRNSLARRERISLGGRGLFDLSQSSTTQVHTQRTTSPSRRPPSEDVIMEETASQERRFADDDLEPARLDSQPMYPNLRTIDFSAHKSPNKPAPATPRFTGIRELFQATAAPSVAHSPALSSVRELFRPPEIRQIPATPALEAARTMFETFDKSMETIDEDPSGRISPASTDGASVSEMSETNAVVPSRPASRLARLAPAAPVSAEPGASSRRGKRPAVDIEEGGARAPRKAAQSRRRTPEPSATTSDEPPARATTRGKGITAQALGTEASETEDELRLVAAPKSARDKSAKDAEGPHSRLPEPKTKVRAGRTVAKPDSATAAVGSRRPTAVSETEGSDVPRKARVASKPATARKVSAHVEDKENDESVEQEAKPKRRVAAKPASSDAPTTTVERVTRSRARK